MGERIQGEDCPVMIVQVALVVSLSSKEPCNIHVTQNDISCTSRLLPSHQHAFLWIWC